eukprot:GHVR01165216.1.p2 GENE.GHVR01165216.1~~GHVR01165216.1.p2  ORF type:complete len:110 (+),score=13.67 GHVR01165216.1:71-400(+)
MGTGSSNRNDKNSELKYVTPLTVYFCSAARGEAAIENSRRTIALDPSLCTTAIFKALDVGSKNHISSYDLSQIASRYNPEMGSADFLPLVVQYGGGYTNGISFNDHTSG